ncbi:MAG: hypothetical protein J6I68_00145 [Butyrivibrio sp.]|uniref:hypothetical protein n=1 Tax=Butyrivibrio sp. TaxID=28121 RepID=UPI001B461D86|nr:hypothetical protein [Butyrivibrio sp.]MBP3781638.1 hypothetical protein [Butyrivibrio sp.]
MTSSAAKTVLDIKELCYELYKIDWMRRITPKEQMESLKNYYQDLKVDGRAATYEEALSEIGFGGQIYACYEEFLQGEYTSRDYMVELLDDEALEEEYIADLYEEGWI